MKKTVSIITSFTIWFLAVGIAGAQSERPRILIYNLSLYESPAPEPLQPDDKDAPARKKKPVKKAVQEAEKPEYFAIILSQAIAASLEATGRYTIERVSETLPEPGEGGAEAYAETLTRLGEEHDAAIVLGGKFAVTGKRLLIDLRMVTVKTKKLEYLTKEREEIGVELTGLIDEISGDLDRNFAGREQKRQQPPAEQSPFMKAYRAMKGFYFGMNMGHYFIQGPWKGLFYDAEYIAPHVGYTIIPWLNISLDADYVATHNKDRLSTMYRSLVMWGVTANLGFHLPIHKFFSAGIIVGTGGAWSSISFTDATIPPYMTRPSTRKSTDPLMNLAIEGTVKYAPVQFTFGTAYKCILYKDKPLSMITVYAGVGFHL